VDNTAKSRRRRQRARAEWLDSQPQARPFKSGLEDACPLACRTVLLSVAYSLDERKPSWSPPARRALPPELLDQLRSALLLGAKFGFSLPELALALADLAEEGSAAGARACACLARGPAAGASTSTAQEVLSQAAANASSSSHGPED
jgi:hypothetical protein